MKNSAGDASRSSEPMRRPAGAPPTDAAELGAALADVVSPQDALRVPPPSTTTARSTFAPLALRRRPAAGAPPIDAAELGAASADVKPAQDALRMPPPSTTTPRSTPERHDHDEDESRSRRGCGAALLRALCKLSGRSKSQSSKLCGGSAPAPDQEDHFGAAAPAVVVSEPSSIAASPAALVITDFAFSVAQLGFQASVPKPWGRGAYQTARKDGAVFFKDATPKADHFMRFRVTLPKSLQNVISGDALRLALTLYTIDKDGERVVVVGHGVEHQEPSIRRPATRATRRGPRDYAYAMTFRPSTRYRICAMASTPSTRRPNWNYGCSMA